KFPRPSGRFPPPRLDHPKFVLASHERAWMAAEAIAMLGVGKQAPPAAGPSIALACLVEDESRAKERSDRGTDECGVRLGTATEILENRRHPAIGLHVDPSPPAHVSHETLIRMNGEGDRGAACRGRAGSPQRVLDRHGRERRPPGSVLDLMHPERGGASR